MSGAVFPGGVMTVNLTLYVFAICSLRPGTQFYFSTVMSIDSDKCRSTAEYKCRSTVISVL